MKRSVFTVIGVIGIVLLVGLMQFDRISVSRAAQKHTTDSRDRSRDVEAEGLLK